MYEELHILFSHCVGVTIWISWLLDTQMYSLGGGSRLRCA